MRPYLRRKLDIFLTILATAAIAGVAVAGSAVGDNERVATIWVEAKLADGDLSVAEVIDYDFGLQRRRGIYRDVDDLDPDANISVSSPSAPDEFVVFDQSFSSQLRARIRVGDPSVTISGRHRYNIGFPLTGLADDDVLKWDAVGEEWSVSIQRAEILLTSDRELNDVQCLTGPAGSWDTCTAEALAPGVVKVSVKGLAARHAVTLYANLGNPVPASVADSFLPSGSADDPGIPTLSIIVVALIAALAASVPVALVIRRLGREKVSTGGTVAAAFGGSIDGIELVDHEDLADMATTAFAPPEGISAAHAGVLYLEAIPKAALPAWLVERAIAGEIEIEGEGKDLTIHRTDIDPDPLWRPTINKMFGGRKKISLAKYDKKFTAGRAHLNKKLEKWQKDSSYWDPAGQVMQVRVRALSVAGGIIGLAITAGAGAASARWGGPWIAALVVGAALAGASASSMVRAWELLVRSPEGSAMWIHIESFRRFLEGSEAEHVENAAAMGVMREYTAWAIALDETKAWTKAVERAAADSPEFSRNFGADLYIAFAARNIASAAARGSTAPSSSGSGGGGGFSAGGGGGGGGGGSW